MRIWKTGEVVRIRYGGRTVEGHVLLASANGKSLALGFEALLGGFLGTMPVLFDEPSGTFRDLIEKRVVELAPASPPARAAR